VVYDEGVDKQKAVKQKAAGKFLKTLPAAFCFLLSSITDDLPIFT
jgi:hypothetical protein